ncbi:hypothetical protein [Bythopirellula polymerisocia]|uniref:Uncharacterized protein n=1 Tax=Bythopirellula polymerisocia TaxID=2528003 RepID=A0A5C6CBB3_9BACT|nr:hypothetical protein [Bythopirellula polymerisocia]TWU20721.1 hypothetical protein Pla144_48880 [Bythopirellula polymerisocia]
MMNTRTSDDDHDQANLGPLLDLPTIEADEFANWTPDEVAPVVKPTSQSKSEVIPSRDNAKLRLLQAIVDHPGMPSSKYPKLAQISPRKAVELRRLLVEQGLVRETQLQTKARGRAAIVLTPTKEGAEVLLAHDEGQASGRPTL